VEAGVKRLAPYLSPNLRRHHDSQFVVQCMMLGISVAFWIAAKASHDPVMDARTYGEWVVGIDAEIWAASIMLASFVFLMGIVINGEWRHSPIMRFIGAAWHVLTLGAFCVGSFGAPFGDPILIMSGGAFCVHLWFAWINWKDLRGLG
jgi:hypothetical protein